MIVIFDFQIGDKLEPIRSMPSICKRWLIRELAAALKWVNDGEYLTPSRRSDTDRMRT
jgi:hypothetical protein